MIICRGCDKQVEPKAAKQAYCTVPCARESRHKDRLDTDLKRKFDRQRRREGLTRKAAAGVIGMGYSAMRGWLKGPDARLGDELLGKIATWLSIDIDEAMRLQGGPAIEHRRAAMAIAQHTWQTRVAKHPKLSRRAVKAMNDAVRGRPFTKEHRAHLSASIKAYRKRPEAHPLHRLDSNSIESRLATTLRNHMRMEPGSSAETIGAWAQRTSDRYDVCIGLVRSVWNHQLARNKLPQMGGKPADVSRCDAMRRYASVTSRRYGFWLSAPDTKSFCKKHARGCPALHRALTQTVYKPPSESIFGGGTEKEG